MFKSVGKRAPKLDGIGHVTGKSVYVSDMRMPGMLTVKALRSPYHKAKIITIDITEAEKLPGVYGVVTHKDVPHNKFGMLPDQEILAEDIIRFKGQCVAAVAAINKETALTALGKIKLELQELPAAIDPVAAMKPDAPIVRPGTESNLWDFDGTPYRRIRRGDVEQGFAEADEIFECTYTTPQQEHAPIETCSTLAYVDNTGKLVVNSKSQGIYFAGGDISAMLQIPWTKLKMVGSSIGGAFGAMNSIHTDHIAALLAMKTGKPVKWEFTREEEMMYTTIRGAWVFKFKDGVKKDGKITARRIEIIHDCGAYTDLGLYALEKNANFVAGALMVPNVSIDSYLVYTNKVPSSSMRGFGINIGQFAEQVHLNKMAEKIGIDPFAIRFINAFKEGDESHVGNTLVAVSGIETMQGAAELAGIKLPDEYLSMSSK